MPDESDDRPDDGTGPEWGPPSGDPEAPSPAGGSGDDADDAAGAGVAGSPRSVAFPAPQRPQRRRRALAAGIAAVVVAALVVTGVVVVLTSGEGAPSIATADGEVVEPDVVLGEVTTEFTFAVASAGATAGSRAGCFWALDHDGEGDALTEAIACGPARFAAGGDWLLVPIDSDPAGDGLATVTYSMAGSRFVDAEQLGVRGSGGSTSIELVGLDDSEPQPAELEPPSREGHAFIPDGRRLEDADEIVNAGRWAIAATTGDVAPRVHDEASCWLPSDEIELDGSDRDMADRGDSGDDGDLADMATLVCGPVLELDDDETMPWKLLRFEVQPAGGPWAVAGDPATLTIVGSMPFPDGVDLFHPAGEEVPSADGFTPPDPLPVGRRYAALAFASDLDDEYFAGLELDDMQASTIRTPDFTVTLGGRATTDRLGEGADALIAPDGHEFVVFTYGARPAGPRAAADEESSQLYLVAGDRARELRLGELRAVGGPSDEPRADRMHTISTRDATVVVIAVVPSNADDVELAIRNRGRAQRVSLVSGRRTLGLEGINRHGDVIDVAVPFDIALSSPGASTAPTPPAGGGFLRGRVARARVMAWSGERRWAPEGTVLLAVEIPEMNDEFGGPGWLPTYLWPQTVTLRTPDDRILQPIGVAGAPQPLATRPRPLLFAVPAEANDVALIIEPQGFARLPQADLQYPLAIDQPFEVTIGLR